LNLPVDIVERALTGRIDTGTRRMTIPDFFIPHAGAANFPWKSHALWYYSQMARWGEIAAAPAQADIAVGTFRPDLYRAALAEMSVPVPAEDYRPSGDQTQRHSIPTINGTMELGPNR